MFLSYPAWSGWPRITTGDSFLPQCFVVFVGAFAQRPHFAAPSTRNATCMRETFVAYAIKFITQADSSSLVWMSGGTLFCGKCWTLSTIIVAPQCPPTLLLPSESHLDSIPKRLYGIAPHSCESVGMAWIGMVWHGPFVWLIVSVLVRGNCISHTHDSVHTVFWYSASHFVYFSEAEPKTTTTTTTKHKRIRTSRQLCRRSQTLIHLLLYSCQSYRAKT